MANQGYIVRGMKKKPLTLAAGIRAQAGGLGALYGQRQQREYQDAQIGLGESNLKLGQQRLQMDREQFKENQGMQREAADTAMGGMFLSGGLGLAKAGMTSGMFDDRITQAKSWFQGGASGKQAAAIDYSPSAADNPSQQGGDNLPLSGGQSGWDKFTGGDWKAGAMGGITGGMIGAGAAKALGARKKWQTAAVGAATGMFSSWMAGADSPWSMALGGMLGGGMGALM